MPTLTILHTNDLEANFEQMTRLGTLIQRERAQAHAEQRQVLLLDAGGSSDKTVWQSDVTQGRANYLLLEALGYDASAPNEADWQWGAPNLKRLVEAVHFPLLAANLREVGAETLPEGVRGYVIFRFEGISVGVVGLTQTSEAGELETTDAADALGKALPELQKEGAQLVIVLSHLGGEADRQMATDIPGIHLILGGHGQSGLAQSEVIGSTLVAQAGKRGENLGRVVVGYDETGLVTALTGELIPCPASTPPDPTASGMLELIEFEAGVARKKAK